MNDARRVALITGAASGIGRSVAELFVSRNRAVVLTDVDDAQGEIFAEQLRHSGAEAVFLHGDVAKPADSRKAVDLAMSMFGRLDVACNNAGIGGEQHPLADYPVDAWQRVIDVNLSGVFYGMKYQIPAMLASGGGSVINIASILGQVAFPGAPAYVAAKHGVVGLTKAAALDYSAQGVRVNAIGPAFISTPMIAQFEDDPAMNEMLVSMHPIGRLGKPKEIAELVYWLGSSRASFITGAYIPVDGGFLAR